MQWRLDDAPGSTFEGIVVQVSPHPEALDERDLPIELFLVEDGSGQLHVFLPMFRENDYGMVWFEVRGPVGFHEKLFRWKFTDRRLALRGPVHWRTRKRGVHDGTDSGTP